MKGSMKHFFIKGFLLVSIAFLQACGGSSDEKIYTISTDISNASFSNEIFQQSTQSIAVQVTFEGDGILVGFPPEQDPVPWLAYRAENVTDNSATIFIEVINEERLRADTYASKLRIAVSNDNGEKFASKDIDVSLLVWQLTPTTAKLNYSATLGDASVASQQFDIISENNQWAASSDVDWLSLDVTSGTGNGTITVTANTQEFIASGIKQGNIILTEVTSGDSKVLPVDLALDNIYYQADTPVIALTKTTNIEALEKTLNISNNSEHVYPWQASTEADWLTLTIIDDNKLHITADSSLTQTNAVNTAEIIITSIDENAVYSENVIVNFYHSDLVVENKIIEPTSIDDGAIVTSPALPVFYTAAENTLRKYHQYTGELENTLIVSPEGTLLEQLIIHPRGDYILAKALETIPNDDETTTEVVHRYRINLADNTITELLDADILYEPTDIVRLSSRYFVITQTLEYANEALQVQFWDSANAYFASDIDVAKQRNNIFALNYSTATINRYTTQVNDFGEQSILTTLTHEYRPESLADDQFINNFVIADDEKHLYTISETTEWSTFDGTSFIDQGLLEATAGIVTLQLEKNQSNQPHFLRINTTNLDGFYVDIYDEQQNISATIQTEGNQPSSMKISSDGQRLILNANAADPLVTDRIELVTLTP